MARGLLDAPGTPREVQDTSKIPNIVRFRKNGFKLAQTPALQRRLAGAAKFLEKIKAFVAGCTIYSLQTN